MWEGSVEVAMRRCRGSFSGGKRRHGGAMRRAVTRRFGRLGDVCDIVTTHHPGSARSSHRSPPRGSRCRRGWPWCPRVSRGITKRDAPLPTGVNLSGAPRPVPEGASQRTRHSTPWMRASLRRIPRRRAAIPNTRAYTAHTAVWREGTVWRGKHYIPATSNFCCEPSDIRGVFSGKSSPGWSPLRCGCTMDDGSF